jgi:hypothetical protein
MVGGDVPPRQVGLRESVQEHDRVSAAADGDVERHVTGGHSLVIESGDQHSHDRNSFRQIGMGGRCLPSTRQPWTNNREERNNQRGPVNDRGDGGMERHEVETFLALAEELHFGRTAQRLRLSTARVSQTIRRLERRVGAPLFERTSRTVALTPIGRQFRDDLEPARALMNAALGRAIAAAREVSRVLRVGFLGPTAGDFLLAAVSAFGEHHPVIARPAIIGHRERSR